MSRSLLPTFEDLSDEQEAVYRLPLDGSSLVSGPPGTGKTVLALYRAQRLMKSATGFRLVTHAKPLMQYVQSSAHELGIDGHIATFHSFLALWWKSRTGRNLPSLAKWEYDWNEILAHLKSAPEVATYRHLIIDEGQDIHPMFWLVQRWLAPSMTVFADENQRITDQNSTIREIINHSLIPEEAHYRLTRNYRNTAQIHAVASAFDVGMGDGAAQPPTRPGDRPEMVRFDDDKKDVEFIVRMARLRRDWQIGVFVPDEQTRRRMVNQLEYRLAASDDPELQTYSWKLGQSGIELDWTIPGVFVLCYPSAKGLQFDHVFLPRLELASGSPADELLRMRFYVLVTRARHALTASWNGPVGSARPAIAQMFPTELMELDE